MLKENGAPFVVSRAARDVHAKFLLRNGADDVIYPERQMASWAAVRYSSGHIFDYVELTPEYSIFETAVPESWVGKTVVDLEVRQKYRINILAIQRGGKLEPLPGPGHCFQAHETMFILGDNRDMKKFKAVINAPAAPFGAAGLFAEPAGYLSSRGKSSFRASFSAGPPLAKSKRCSRPYQSSRRNVFCLCSM